MSPGQIQGLRLVVIFSMAITLVTPMICWALTLPVDRIFEPVEGDVSNIVHQILP
ncbi:hypothetical protein IQ260_06040 [Leptolyngbya cf. ectocarpi LEGE 11479]|uniref:Uncharacterized protein n=1 Tax=Leptolyngbya cf. ectocarpi LEGE 11479 TaxID=1828722 RepID=A0A928ZR68_LEPEC|nr:hypothetical protein [Leptolyngbya cf. ectocarpi LEGE 11479]